MVVSINGGTPKWMVYNGKSHCYGWLRGTPIFGNHQMVSLRWLLWCSVQYFIIFLQFWDAILSISYELITGVTSRRSQAAKLAGNVCPFAVRNHTDFPGGQMSDRLARWVMLCHSWTCTAKKNFLRPGCGRQAPRFLDLAYIFKSLH